MMTNRMLWMWLPVMTAMFSGSLMGAAPGPRFGNAPRRPPSSQPAQAPEGAKLERDLEYGRVGQKRLLLDLYLPEKAEGPLPLITWIHGGGWQSGSKEQCLPARQGFIARGYAVASVNYRLSGEAPFPAQIEDCKAAIRWLRANAKKYSLDPDHIGVWGSSAGGHLVALLGAAGEVKEWDTGANANVSSRLQAVCDFYGPTDLAQFVVTPGYEGHAKADSPESKMIGGAVLENKDKAMKANPIAYVGKDDPPFLIVHGDKDPVVPPSQSQLLYDALNKADVEASLHFLPGAKHGGAEFNDPTVIELVAAFFDKHLKGVESRAALPGNPKIAAKPEESSKSTAKPVKPSEAEAGLLFFASYPERFNTAAVSNPHVIGALHTMYWSQVEVREGLYDWSEIERQIKPWIDGGKKVALRIMWSSSGRWPAPEAKHPTPQWVLDKGAAIAVAPQSKTQVPLVWDPVYRQYAGRFLREVAKRFDADPNVLFIDVTPGAETNPYRGRMDQAEPQFKPLFLDTPASDGRKYSDDLWLKTIQQCVDSATATFKRTSCLATLNNGGLERQQFHEIGAYCVAKGCFVGQNGLREASYLQDSPRRTDFLEWGKQTRLYFEMNAASGPRAGALMEIMKAAERIGCDYLGVYAVDVLKGTQGEPTFDPAWEEALRYGAQVVGKGVANPTAQAWAPQSRPVSPAARPRPDENAPPQWVKEPIEAPNLYYHTFHSATINGPVSYLIYLPPEYEKSSDKRDPVMYWLHGRGGAQTGLPAFCERLTKAIEDGKTPPMIVVFVNGLPYGSYVDSADGKSPVESVTIKDLIPHIDQTYRTIAKREGRIVEGFSMGGSGAAKWGFKYPDLFCGIGIMAGALLDMNSLTQRDGGQSFQRVYGGSREYFEANNAWSLAEKNADAVRGRTTIRIVVGADDGLREPNTKFHELLDRLKIEHEFRVIEGAAHSHAPLYDGLGEENWAFYRKAFGTESAGAGSVSRAVAQADSPEKPAASPAAMPSSKPAAAPKPGFQLNAERWTWEGDGLSLKGILVKPQGDGPFPAIVISHGLGGSAESFALSKAREMVKWGFVCIGTDYTHAGRGEFTGQRRGPQGAGARGAKAGASRPSAPNSRPSVQRGPGSAPAGRPSDSGASPENLRRAMKCVEILKSLPYVDSKRICAYGNSMGAFLTIALAANAPGDIACAAISAGGVRSGEEGAFASPTEQTAEGIRCPFLIFHGTADTTVRPEMSERLKEILDKNGVPNERILFEGIGHNAHMEKAEDVYRIMREWFTKHGALKPQDGKQN